MQIQWEYIEAKLLSLGYTRETLIGLKKRWEAEIADEKSRSLLNQQDLSMK